MAQLPSLPARLPLPNRRDLIALPLVFGLIYLVAWAGGRMSAPYVIGQPLPISLDPTALPGYALYTVLRMAAALGLSLLFALVYATLAAKNRYAERILVPALDVLQSVPILGYLSITVAGFVALFPGSLWGVQMAVIFAVFTSQAWNMAFSLYHSLKTVPRDLSEAASTYQLSPWLRFWRLELPYAMPGLVWNTMMSVSGGWFFVVAAEAITVGGHQIMVPGVGSYIALAIQQRDLGAIGWAIVTMLGVILLYDWLFFRPVVAWADKFKFESSASGNAPESMVLDFIKRTRIMRLLAVVPGVFWQASLRLGARPKAFPGEEDARRARWLDLIFNLALALTVVGTLIEMWRIIPRDFGWDEVGHVFLLGGATALRVFVLVLLASVVWVPIGIWIGLRPRLAQRVQPLAQFLAAFPANLLFPLVVVVIVGFHLNVDVWVSPLMILGSQWYILFNVIGGAAALPSDLKEASRNLGLRGWLRFRRLLFPGVFQSYVTGAITASGGAWNASIVAEVVSWGSHTLVATGLGAYIAQATARGDVHHVVLGTGVMALFVITINRFVWHRLYQFAETHWRLD
ncbi:ABC transporter permease [Acidihalobacter prosperus]|uniref:Sulfonate ABC transporter permease n=1 Tax=Acidihalobacter prosperus TaxID=160660 RepID=A0A1A6C4N6_9GAMM|nr:ABC transporter permease subunit [Acidihalobacter prosperus]OBS09522.1 sulfonate ABC transporter permease [Acidihalobacter prosperus]